MRFSTSAALAALLSLTAAQTRSSKRGLVFTPNVNYPQDNSIWVQSGSDLTWYYNYQDVPSPAFAMIPQDKFEFVPMMWGVNVNNLDDDSFYKSIQRQVKNGLGIKRVLGFNEPDGTFDVGGSNVVPANAARAWVANFIPIQAMGIKVGLPACTGQPFGLIWLKEFLGNCSQIISAGGPKKNCTYDFLPVHWYDNFEGIASHIGERVEHFPNTPIWVTEYAYAHRELQDTQAFYNTSAEYFDRLDYLERYSYFGAFRSKISNVGPNAAFLNNDGKLTDIGSWYLGFSGSGVQPTSGDKTLPNAAPGLQGREAVVLAVVAGVVGAVASLL